MRKKNKKNENFFLKIKRTGVFYHGGENSQFFMKGLCGGRRGRKAQRGLL